MAEINYSLLRYQADNIPVFDGNSKLLIRFITASENLLKAFQDRQNPSAPINICLLDTIFSKLRGRAADLICPRQELSNWALVKEVLMLTFSDQRNIDCLVQDLISLKPSKNENMIDYGNKLQDVRSLLFAKLNQSNDDRHVKLIKIENYNSLALKTFISNLPYHMQLVVRLQNPDSLEQAISFVVEEQNFNQYKNRTSNIPNNSNMTNKPINNGQRPPITYQRPYNFQTPSTSHQYSPMQKYNNQPFNQNRNPFNYNSNYNNTFKPQPVNVFKPQSQVSRFLPKPTPMDISSGNSKFTRTNNPSRTMQLHNQYILDDNENESTDSQLPDSSYYNNDNYNNLGYPENPISMSHNSQNNYQELDSTQYGYDDTVPYCCTHGHNSHNNEQIQNNARSEEYNNSTNDFSNLQLRNFQTNMPRKPET